MFCWGYGVAFSNRYNNFHDLGRTRGDFAVMTRLFSVITR